jgi:hypothetical protein
MISDGQPPDISRDILRDIVDRKPPRRERKLSRRVTLRSLAVCICARFRARRGGERERGREGWRTSHGASRQLVCLGSSVNGFVLTHRPTHRWMEPTRRAAVVATWVSATAEHAGVAALRRRDDNEPREGFNGQVRHSHRRRLAVFDRNHDGICWHANITVRLCQLVRRTFDSCRESVGVLLRRRVLHRVRNRFLAAD